MFTDIVGYTALMGENEERAFQLLNKNREIHQPIIDIYNGKLIKELGDGILASFPTVSDALFAAIQIQQACSASKELSLRIGIHEGEIILEKNDIYGDAVNIASRIQTLGIPGSILFSKKVADEIKNKAEFHTVSLGSFEFKNVNEPIEIFALTNDDFPVPKRSMMDGKLKKKNFRKRNIIVSVSFILLAVAAFIIYNKYFINNNDAGIDKSIAVLPFVDMSAGKDQEYFSDGLSEELLNLLSKISELKVIGRTSSFSFKGKNEDLRSIARKLGVAHILEGSVRKDGNKIRVTAQLIRATDGSHLWSETYDRDLAAIFKLQDDIARAVVKQLKLKLLPPTAKTDASINTESYNLMLQGNYLAEKRDKVNTAKAIDLYLQALTIDSLDHRLWAALAHGLSIQASWGWVNPHEGYEKVRNAATKSISLEENQAEAHRIIGDMKMYYDWDWEGAENEFNKALNLEPRNPDLLRSMGSLTRILGRLDESFRWLKKSIDLDPLKPITYFHLGFQQIYAAHFEEAIVTYKKILELSPQFPGAHTYLSEVYLLQGKPDKALTEIQQELSKRRKGFGLAVAYSALQRQKEAEDALRDYIAEFQRTDMYMIAETYAFFGEKNKAFEWLEKAYNGRDVRLTWVKGDPLLKNLYNDPRYNAFLKKMNLPLD
jgi:TolB-like protein/Tfp pilus assembly protein PilF